MHTGDAACSLVIHFNSCLPTEMYFLFHSRLKEYFGLLTKERTAINF